MRKSFIVLVILFLSVPLCSWAVTCPDELLNKKIAVILGAKSPLVSDEIFQQIVASIEDNLIEYGFNPIDQSKLKELIPEEQKKLLLAGDTVGAIRLSDKLGADLFLLGNISLRRKKIPGYSTGIHSVFLTISFKLMGAHNAKIIATGILSKKSAGVDTLETVLKILGRSLKPTLDKIYKQYCRKGINMLAPGSKVNSQPSQSGGAAQMPSAGNAGSQPDTKSSLEDL